VRQGIQLPQGLGLGTRPRQRDDAAGGIDVLDGGVDGFLPVEHLHQPFKTRVGHPDNAHMRFRAPTAVPASVGAGKDLKQRRLAYSGQPHDTDSQQGHLRTAQIAVPPVIQNISPPRGAARETSLSARGGVLSVRGWDAPPSRNSVSVTFMPPSCPL
jgi:hypothetical protein